MQETKSLYASYKMQNQILQSSVEFMHGKIKRKILVHLHEHFVETIALILHSKVVFRKLFWLKLFRLKNTLHALNPFIPRGNKRSFK